MIVVIYYNKRQSAARTKDGEIMKLLQIDASPRQDSVSRQLTSHFAENWKQQMPGGQVIHRDLANSPLGLITDDWIAGAHSNPAQHTTAHRSALQYSDISNNVGPVKIFFELLNRPLLSLP